MFFSVASRPHRTVTNRWARLPLFERVPVRERAAPRRPLGRIEVFPTGDTRGNQRPQGDACQTGSKAQVQPTGAPHEERECRQVCKPVCRWPVIAHLAQNVTGGTGAHEPNRCHRQRAETAPPEGRHQPEHKVGRGGDRTQDHARVKRSHCCVPRQPAHQQARDSNRKPGRPRDRGPRHQEVGFRPHLTAWCLEVQWVTLRVWGAMVSTVHHWPSVEAITKRGLTATARESSAVVPRNRVTAVRHSIL